MDSTILWMASIHVCNYCRWQVFPVSAWKNTSRSFFAFYIGGARQKNLFSSQRKELHTYGSSFSSLPPELRLNSFSTAYPLISGRLAAPSSERGLFKICLIQTPKIGARQSSASMAVVTRTQTTGCDSSLVCARMVSGSYLRQKRYHYQRR